MKGTAMNGIEQRIRERAYLLWEADGRPQGREIEYWERARFLIGGGEPTSTVENGREPNVRGPNGATAAAKSARTASASPDPVAKPGGKRARSDTASTKPAKRKASRSK